MVAIAATSYATPSAQVWQVRARLDQARRQADQAEANAVQLRSQADQAEQEAQKGQQNVRAVSAQVAQADSTYSAQLRNQAAASTAQKVQAALAPVSAVASNQFSFPANPLVGKASLWQAADQRASSGRLVDLTV